MNFIISFCAVLGSIISFLTIYQSVFFVIGLFRRKTFPKTDNKHTFGICIAARNEESVISNLLDSISKQDYPLDNVCVFVVADNCTDKTAEICRNFKRPGLNVVVYEHNNPQERTKGFALKYLFEQISIDFGINRFDGYFIFDADNLLCNDYLTRMNEAFDAGNKIVTSFRNSKNLNQNWISFSYGMHWMRTCLTENRAKSFLNQACRIQGTGFLFANELVADGWKWTSLTEDRTFCSDAVIRNYRISYCEKAMFYDEQPYKIKVALRQRIRWAKGHLQAFAENDPKLLKNLLFNPDVAKMPTYDHIWLNMPTTVITLIRRILTYSMSFGLAIMAGDAWGGV